MAVTHSYGGSVLVDWAGGTSYSALANVVSFNGPSLTRTKSPAWHLLSTSRFKTKVGGLLDADDLQLTLRYDKTQFAAFYTNIATAAAGIKVLCGDSATLTFTGFIAEAGGPEHGDDDTISQTVSLCCNSLPVFTP